MTFHYPNRMGRVLLDSMEEVMGRNTLQEALSLADQTHILANSEHAFSFETISALLAGLEQTYGSRGGRGLAQRMGRICFKYGLCAYGETLGLTITEFRLLPLRIKLRTAGQSLAGLFNELTDQRVRFEEADTKLFWRIERCPLCWERHTEEAVCHLAVGLLQESMYWLSNGKIYRVEETQCAARGESACVFEIDTTPLD